MVAYLVMFEYLMAKCANECEFESSECKTMNEKKNTMKNAVFDVLSVV